MNLRTAIALSFWFWALAALVAMAADRLVMGHWMTAIVFVIATALATLGIVSSIYSMMAFHRLMQEGDLLPMTWREKDEARNGVRKLVERLLDIERDVSSLKHSVKTLKDRNDNRKIQPLRRAGNP